MHHLVLLRAEAQGDVLVGDAGQQVVRQVGGVVDQEAGESGNGSCQRLLLPAVSLVAAVEQTVKQFGVLLEHVLVEAGGDVLDVFADDRKGRLDHGVRGVGKHGQVSFKRAAGCPSPRHANSRPEPATGTLALAAGTDLPGFATMDR